jgi:diaminopimelate epimerase
MTLSFDKYQGSGNDFILIDNRDAIFDKSDVKLVARLCDRRFGIGADGLMLLEHKTQADFEMIYYNSDGRLSSMCGNGGRCIMDFAKNLGVIRDQAVFLAADGLHEAHFKDSLVRLKMSDVKNIEAGEGFFFLDTGSPHLVKFVTELSAYDVFHEGRSIRNSPRFLSQGTNVNFAQSESDALFVRTYERGVEDETLACGTGVTAAALVAALKGVNSGTGQMNIRTPGGLLKVYYEQTGDNSFRNIWLEGPATKVFHGEIQI